MARGQKLWEDFGSCLLVWLRDMSPEQARAFFANPSDRTTGYCKDLLPRIGQLMNMGFVCEGAMRFDFQLRNESGLTEIFVESENYINYIVAWNVHADTQELEKLCYVRAPLKVIITSTEPYLGGRQRDRRALIGDLKNRSVKRIAEFAKWLPESSEAVYGFAIGDSASAYPKLLYHLFAVSSTGEVIDDRPDVLVNLFHPATPPAA